MSTSTWRARLAPVIREVLEETKGQNPREVHKALLAAWRHGERRGWIYKVWCSEIRRQKGLPARIVPIPCPALPGQEENTCLLLPLWE